jgi:acetyl esterase/lipase
MIPFPIQNRLDGNTGLPGQRQLPPRLLPVPTTVSVELRGTIAAAPGALFGGVIDGAEELRRKIRAADKKTAARARSLWRQLSFKIIPTSIAEVSCYQMTPPVIPPEKKDRLLVHLHDGGFMLNGAEGATVEAALVSYVSGAATIAVDYRRPPDAPFPAALEDAVAVWKSAARAHAPSRMALCGSSTGAGLAMATVLRLKELGIPLPGALFLGTPCADLTKTGDSYFTNEGVDGQLVAYEGSWAAMLRAYAGHRDLKDPLLSPLYGDLRGFPPTVLISGTRDLLLSDTVRVHRKLRQSGVEAELHVFEAQSHHEYVQSFPSPESQEALSEIARFFDRHLGS